MMRIVALVVATVFLIPSRVFADDRNEAVTYHVETWQGDASALHARFTDAEIRLLEKLNRRDLANLERYAGPLVVAEPWSADELAFSPLPRRWRWAEALPKAIVVHQPWQVYGAYEYGSLVRWGPVSTGRQDRSTPPGLYYLNWRSRGRHSTVDANWYMEWYFNFDNRHGLSMHAYALPGRPASHACVRLLDRDARWIFAWGEEWQVDANATHVLRNGTPLWIIGRYEFASPPPWLQQDQLGQVLELPAQSTSTTESIPSD